jgi:HD superfamily phosphodiesterase
MDFELDLYKPCQEWYARQEEIGGIHGIGHAARVLVWADNIGRWLNANNQPVDLQAVRWAAILHDTQRWDDGTDPEHGKRSGAWLAKNHKTLPYEFSPAQLKTACYCCIWHVPQDKFAPRMTPELMCMKDADGLDRVRLYDLDVSFLRTPYAKRQVETAYWLFKSSLAYDTGDQWEAVRRAAIELNLWR